MKNNQITKLVESTQSLLTKLSHIKLLIFVLLVVGVYGYVILTISSLTNAQPSEEQITELSSPLKSAKIDDKLIKQLQQLQDNSVSVKALFNEARSNPFQETE
jgi:hypothetical protein